MWGPQSASRRIPDAHELVELRKEGAQGLKNGLGERADHQEPLTSARRANQISPSIQTACHFRQTTAIVCQWPSRLPLRRFPCCQGSVFLTGGFRSPEQGNKSPSLAQDGRLEFEVCGSGIDDDGEHGVHDSIETDQGPNLPRHEADNDDAPPLKRNCMGAMYDVLLCDVFGHMTLHDIKSFDGSLAALGELHKTFFEEHVLSSSCYAASHANDMHDPIHKFAKDIVNSVDASLAVRDGKSHSEQMALDRYLPWSDCQPMQRGRLQVVRGCPQEVPEAKEVPTATTVAHRYHYVMKDPSLRRRILRASAAYPD